MKKVGGLETTAGPKIAGHRGYFLVGDLYLLAHALQSYALSFLVKKGYTPVYPPMMMTKENLLKTCQLSDLYECLYELENDDKVLIATSEQPLSCYFLGSSFIENESLPSRFAGVSSCFRKEAGSSGKDMRGIFRVH